MEQNTNPDAVEKKSFTNIIKESLKELGETIVAFVKAPRALWGINIPYILEGLVYFGILTILGKFCSENAALSDLHSGWVYGGVTGGITFFMLILGGVSDKLGLRRSLALALFTMMIGRTIISLSGTLSLGSGVGSPMFYTMIAGLFLMVAAYGLYQPAAYAGVKRYTNPKTAAMGYAVIYGLMNLGAFFSGAISSNTRIFFENTFPPNGLTAVFWVYVGLTGIAFLTTIFVLSKRADKDAVERVGRETAEMEAGKAKNETEKVEKAPELKINNIPIAFIAILFIMIVLFYLSRSTSGVLVSAGEAFFNSHLFFAILLIAVGGIGIWEFLRHRPEHPFRDIRFVYFIFILIPVQTLFAHNWLTLPYYLDRAYTGTIVGRYFEVFSNINPLLIFILAPLVAGLTARANVYRMMILGTFVMAAPTFLLSIGPSVPLLLSYILLMTIGEAMWQPRFLQWIAEIAPEGKTGAYMGIGQLPWFLTKVITSLYSGYFVANYIPRPESGLELRTGEMWFFYALIAIISPVALLMSKKWMIKGMREKSS
jgi:MFS family permease